MVMEANKLKIVVSQEWTDKERLAVIDSIVEYHRLSQMQLDGWGLQQIHMLAQASKGFLEMNRRAFKDYTAE
jgi:hypothetical protein